MPFPCFSLKPAYNSIHGSCSLLLSKQLSHLCLTKSIPNNSVYSVFTGLSISSSRTRSLVNSQNISCFHVNAIFLPLVLFIVLLTTHLLLFNLYISTFQFYMFHTVLPMELKKHLRILSFLICLLQSPFPDHTISSTISWEIFFSKCLGSHFSHFIYSTIFPFIYFPKPLEK